MNPEYSKQLLQLPGKIKDQAKEVYACQKDFEDIIQELHEIKLNIDYENLPLHKTVSAREVCVEYELLNHDKYKNLLKEKKKYEEILSNERIQLEYLKTLYKSYMKISGPQE